MLKENRGIQGFASELGDNEPRFEDRPPKFQMFTIDSEINNLTKELDMLVRNNMLNEAQGIADQIDMLQQQKISIQSKLGDEQMLLDAQGSGIQNFAAGGTAAKIAMVLAAGANEGGSEKGTTLQGSSIESSDINTPDITPGNPEAIDDVQKDFNKFQESLERDTAIEFANGGIAMFADGGLMDIFKDDIFEDKDKDGLSKSVAPVYDATTGKYILNNKEYDSISDAINDTENTQEAIENKRKEEVSQQGTGIENFMPKPYGMTKSKMLGGTGASQVGIQRFRRGGMAGEVGEDYEKEYIYGDDFDEFGPGGFDINEYIKNVLGGGGGYTPPTEEELAEQQAQQRANRISQGYGGGGGSGIGGIGSYSDTRPGASISIDARDETPDAYRFYPSEVSKLYSQMKGVPFSPLVAPPKEATYVDDLQPRRIKSQLYAADGKFVDRSELITGPGGERGDKIPAMLSDGEFVVNAKAVRGMGVAAGADPEDEYQQRLEGARQMYALQKEGEQMMRKYR